MAGRFFQLPGIGFQPLVAGDFFRTGNFQALALFDGGDELAGASSRLSCVPVSEPGMNHGP